MKIFPWLRLRKTRTFLTMTTATLVGFGLTFYEDLFGGIVWMLPPVLLGLAIIFSNLSFLRYGIASILIPILFFGIYLCGTLPFAALGGEIFHNTFSYFVFACLGCLLLTSVVVRIFVKEITLGYKQLLLIVPLALLTEMTYAVVMGQSFATYDVRPDDFHQKVLLYQSAIAIFTVLSMRQNEKPAVYPASEI